MSPKFWMFWFNFFQDNQRLCVNSITERPEIIKMIEDEVKVDVVVAMGTCGRYLAHLLDAKIVNISPGGPYNVHQVPIGDAFNPFVHSHILSKFVEPMTFAQRLVNTITEASFTFFWFWIASKELWYVKQRFPNRLPDQYDIYDTERTMLSLVNSHPATHGPWPKYKNTIEIGGIHCKPGKKLPKDLETYLDSHPAGVVLVSFGSAFSSSHMSSEQLLIFQDSFRELGFPILWKWDSEDLTGMPDNVLVKKWLPQNDILAHPNLRVFVTHGGLLSTQEALFHGVPLVGFPLANDQQANMMRAEENGFAIRLDLQTMSKELLTSAVKRAFADPEMKESMARMHKVFTDHSLTGMTPLEHGVLAINYVMKNEGIKFLKPHKDLLTLANYQVHGYDILALSILAMCLIFIFAWKCLVLCHGKCCGSRKEKFD